MSIPALGERVDRSGHWIALRGDAGMAARGPWGRLLRSGTARSGLAIVIVLSVLALVGPLVVRQDPLGVSPATLEGPSAAHWLGTDGLGRDLFSRVVSGARLSLGSTLLATILIMAIAIAVGCLAGYSGGILDAIIMRVVDIVLAFPGLILALALAGLLSPGLLGVMIALVSVWWAGYARIVRGLTLAVRERSYVEAARGCGAGHLRVIGRHVLPNVLSPVVVLMTLETGQLLLAISALSFLGLGVQPPTPEWGAMLNEGRAYVLSDPLVILVPGSAISLAVLGINLLGDALRDALDPRTLG